MEIFRDLLLQSLVVGEVDDWRVDRLLEVDDALDDIAITRYHRTVEAVQRVIWVVVVLIHHIWHQNPIYLRILVQFLQVAVGELGRKTDVVAHHRVQGALVFLEG